MTTMEPGAAPNLIERVKNILLTPQAEWDRIKPEQTSFQQLIVGYALPLIALSALCTFIGQAFVGVPLVGRYPIQWALTGLVTSVVLGVAMVWLLGFIINAIAPTFGSQQNQMQANKVAVYSATAGWLGGVFTIIPMLGILALVASIYSLVLLWFGLPKLMETPEDKKIGYFATVLVIAILLVLVVTMVVGAVLATMGFSAAAMMGARPY
ncbi:MAG: Yip1 family protein [Hyphomonadaceae bacterium]